MKPSIYSVGNTTFDEGNSPYDPKPPQQKPPQPKTWLAESILATLFCCLPLGIVGIVYSSKVTSLYASGHYDEAEAASAEAGKWTQISAGVGLAGVLFYLVFVAPYM